MNRNHKFTLDEISDPLSFPFIPSAQGLSYVATTANTKNQSAYIQAQQFFTDHPKRKRFIRPAMLLEFSNLSIEKGLLQVPQQQVWVEKLNEGRFMFQLVYYGSKYANKQQSTDAEVDFLLDEMQREFGGYSATEWREFGTQAVRNTQINASINATSGPVQ